MEDHHADSQEWIPRYEQLRQTWLETLRGWGQSVFIRSGMIAWLRKGDWDVPELCWV